MKYEQNPEEADVLHEPSRRAKIIRAAAAAVAASVILFAASHIHPSEAEMTHQEKIDQEYENCLDHMLSKEDVARAHKESFGPFAHVLPDKPQRVMDAMKGCSAYADAVVGPAI